MIDYLAERDEWLFDTEIYWNYFLFAGINMTTGKVVTVEAVGQDSALSVDDRLWLKRFMERRRTGGFNSINFDIPLIYAAIDGRSVRELKRIANAIIGNNLRSWKTYKKYQISQPPYALDHIDLIEVAPGQHGLKTYNARAHGKKLQDLPYGPENILTEEEIQNIFDYCVNDLDATGNVRKELGDQIQLRSEMSEQYGLDLRSKSDAQVAEAVIKQGVEKLLGRRVYKPEYPKGFSFKYDIPDFIEFETKTLRSLLETIRHTRFRLNQKGEIDLPKELADLEIKLGWSTYTLGIGGLHSQDAAQAVESDGEYQLYDKDVTSYYPNIILGQGVFPKQMGGAFLRIYQGLVDSRVKAKLEVKRIEDELKEGPGDNYRAQLEADLRRAECAADGGKIGVNGSFGKLGSRFSALFAPQLLIQTTLTGQLSILMLIERLYMERIDVVSANTDGVVIRCPRGREADMEAIIKEWERDTGFEIDSATYKGIYSANVNSYFAAKEDGSVKRKGFYAKASLQINPSAEVCADAVAEFLSKGTPITETIRSETDIRKFVSIRKAQNGATWRGEYLGKVVRWYYAEEGEEIRSAKATAAGTYSKVAGTDGCRPLMELPNELPVDIDYGAYIKKARQTLVDVGYHKPLI